MSRKWMPITAGILDLLFGAFGTLYGLVVLIAGPLLYGSKNADWEIWGPIYLVTGVLTLFGGVYCLKRKRWRLALMAAISGCLFLIIYLITDFVYDFGIISQMRTYGDYNYLNWDDLGRLLPITAAILAIILTIRSRKQFQK